MKLVPTGRLLLLLAAVLLPCGLVPVVAPQWTEWATAVVLACFAVIAADAFASRRILHDLTLHLPDVIRAVKGKPAVLPLQCARSVTVTSSRSLRIGIPLPPGLSPLEPGGDEKQVALPAEPVRHAAIAWPILAHQRGVHPLREAIVGQASRAGLWELQQRKQLNGEVRVYPNLLADRKAAAAALLTRGKGAHPFRQIGKGREFEKLREYMPGDTFNDIHWRATARHGRPVSKVYRIERTQDVYAVLDCSRLSGRIVDGEPVLERYLSAALLLGLAVQNEGDLFGVIAFDDKVRTIIRAGAGPRHFSACRDALFAVEPRRVSPDCRELSQFLRTRLRKRSLLMVLTHLDDALVAEEFEANMTLVRRNHLVSVNIVRPAGVSPVFHGDPVLTTDDVYDRLAGHLRWQTLEQTRRRLVSQGITLSMLRPGHVTTDLVERYRDIKGRQLL